MTDKLRIGRIPFLNLYPVFHMLEEVADTGDFEFVEGHPAALNRMLREGEVDVSPSSSVEYLRNRGLYTIIDGHSISSRGPVGSIIFFSRVPMENLGGSKVYVTHQSETSVALLRVILEKFHGVRCEVEVSATPFERSIKAHSAYLAIGDEALLGSFTARTVEQQDGVRLATLDHQLFYIYDLGDLWHRQTGLHFVYALWIARRDLNERKAALLDRLRHDLDRAKEGAKKNFSQMAGGKLLPPAEMLSYWESICYDLDEGCMKGLGLFDSYLKEMGMVS